MIMADYIWQLGIDWNAIQTGGVGYLRGGLTRADGVALPGTEPVHPGDQITFRIFDVSSSVPPVPPPGRCVAGIGSFGIDSQGAVMDQPSENPLSKTRPTLASSTASEQSSLFGNAHCSWDMEPVTVTATSGRRFLLTVYLQATGLDNVVRLFSHDPEMIIGEHG
jgi:hypothetical protein